MWGYITPLLGYALLAFWAPFSFVLCIWQIITTSGALFSIVLGVFLWFTAPFVDHALSKVIAFDTREASLFRQHQWIYILLVWATVIGRSALYPASLLFWAFTIYLMLTDLQLNQRHSETLIEKYGFAKKQLLCASLYVVYILLHLVIGNGGEGQWLARIVDSLIVLLLLPYLWWYVFLPAYARAFGYDKTFSWLQSHRLA
jgi:hypothetical protein